MGSECPVYLLVMSIGFPPRLPEPPSVLRLQATQVSEVAGACEQTYWDEVLRPRGPATQGL